MRFRTVIFDCDSTLSAIEGIEELAREHRDQVALLTASAMAGTVPLEQVYGRRLELIRPSSAAIESVGRLYIERLVPGAMETLDALRAAGVAIQILSGGLAPAVRVVARHLGVPEERVAAVELQFSPGGEYSGFDATSLLAQAGGKRRWIETVGRDLPRPSLLVGDGATDLEARPAVDAFAAFTGVVARPEVVRHADVVIPGPSLTQLLAYCRA
jgi:phosphoserine phosphatase